MTERANRIKQLQKDNDIVIMAHYYVNEDVKQIADYIGDSYYLSKIATQLSQKNIVFAGVRFMGESAKVLNPGKTVVMVDAEADCPMAHMLTPEYIAEVRGKYDDMAVVCYVNSTAEMKAVSDVCVTSSNAVRVVNNVKESRVFFVPDNNLGRYVAQKVPQKDFIFHEGCCPVHVAMSAEHVKALKGEHPGALVLAHPQCTEEVIEVSDYVGSTAEIISFASNSSCMEFIICTEMGVFFELQQKCPKKHFYPAMSEQTCAYMKRVTLDKVERVLEQIAMHDPELEEIQLSDDMIEKAGKPLQKMLELAK